MLKFLKVKFLSSHLIAEKTEKEQKKILNSPAQQNISGKNKPKLSTIQAILEDLKEMS